MYVCMYVCMYLFIYLLYTNIYINCKYYILLHVLSLYCISYVIIFSEELCIIKRFNKKEVIN